MCSDSPDIPGPDPLIGQAAKANADVAQKALDWYMQQYDANKPRQQAADELTQKIADQQLKLSDQQYKTTEELTAQGREQYTRALARDDRAATAEKSMYSDAAGYDTPERQEAAAGEAGADVERNMASARDAQRRTMMRMGVNPNSGRFQSGEDAAALTGALGEASAENNARKQTRDMGVMLRKDAANFGRGMASNAAQTYGVASQTGSGATSAGAGAVGALTAGAGMNNAAINTAGNGFNTAIAGNNSAGSMLNTQYAGQLQAANLSKSDTGGLLSGIGGIASGLGAMGFSDEEMKEDIRPTSGKAALTAVKGIDVKKWKYKADSPAADGGREHIGAMAQDMNEEMGEAVAPGGKMVDIISALGVNMAATKELAKQVDKLTKTKKKEVAHV